MGVCVWVCVCVGGCVWVGVCVCGWGGWVCVWVGVWVCVCVCGWVGVCVCVWVCVCVGGCVFFFNIHLFSLHAPLPGVILHALFTDYLFFSYTVYI